MRNWRTMVGALCIIAAMLLGAFAGFTYARDAGVVSASPNTGTRGEDRRIVSAADQAQTPLSDGQAQAIASGKTTTTANASPGNAEVTSADGAVAKAVSPEDQKAAVQQHAPLTDHTVVTSDGSIRVQPTTGTRDFPPGTIDAGGPYGPVNEGSEVAFTVQTNDPTIIFFRWDFNNDGIFDFPNQTGGGSLGKWSTLTTVAWLFEHPYYGNVVVEGWDGVSTTVTFSTGDNLGQGTSPYWYVYPANSGWEFTPKSTIQATQFGWFQWFNQASYGAQVRIWDTTTHATVAECAPPDITYQWNWCTLTSPVTLLAGHSYIIAEHKTIDYYPYWMGFLGPTGGSPPYSPPNPAKITVGDFFYTWTSAYAYPATDGGNNVIMMIDFKWQETLIIPDVATATAHLDIENVVPTVFGITSTPNPALEGSKVGLTAQFSDAGLNETWQYRYRVFYPPTGWTVTPWVDVTKFNGGARVLDLNTLGPDASTFENAIKTKCGAFCVSVDSWDWGPTGVNSNPPLSTLQKYNVVVVSMNYFVGDSTSMGNLLADYMDHGGNVVLAMFDFGNSFGCQGALCGRLMDQMYSPVGTAYGYNNGPSMGTIYVPGHPLLDGVSSISASNYVAGLTSVNPGSTRVVDWSNGLVLAATNTNPKVSNGARIAALNIFPVPGYGAGGDYIQLVVNSIRWTSQQPDPTVKPMPITLDPYFVSYPDDVPTTTPQDSYPVIAEVRDDSDGQIQIQSQTVLYSQDFNNAAQCNGAYYITTTFPPGWTSTPNPYGWTCGVDSTFGSRQPYIYYYYNDPTYGTGSGDSYVTTPRLDLTGYNALMYQSYDVWAGDYPGGGSSGYIRASMDGGATYPITLHEFHHNNPGRFTGTVTATSFALGGQSDVKIDYWYHSSDDWWWGFDNVVITGVMGAVINGLGSDAGTVTVANVPPTITGGFSSALRDEAQSLLFSGFKLSDPALIQPTEWFAYRFNFDDGSPSNWVYRGSLAPPKLSVLVIHSICLGPIDGTCDAGGSGQLTQLVNALLAMDDVGSVATWNFFNYPFTPTAPSLSYMLGFDVIVVATNWAYFSYAPFDLARQQVGDRLAAYVDAGRGGVLSMMCVYCLSGGSDLFSIRGRYMDDNYGAFKRANYVFPGASGITVLDPSDPYSVFVGVGDGTSGDVGSSFIHDGVDPVSIGGNNNAAGRDGVLLAKWSDGNTAVGVKQLNNGMHTAHLGGWSAPVGADWNMLVRNLVGFAHGGLPSPKVPDFTHVWGDNGVYTVSMEAIDDDMGYVWDAAANQPVAVMPTVASSVRDVVVNVVNVDPTIRGTISAFIATQVCVRVSGQQGNTVTANIFVDGVLVGSTSATRQDNGGPNPTTDQCGMFKLDVTGPHTLSGNVVYAQPNGGSNPTWLIFNPWRDPVTPGHGQVSMKIDLGSAGTTRVDLSGLKAGLLDSGQGAKVDFSAEAFDPGTDDLAFLWNFGAVGSTAYVTPGSPTGTYAIHIQHNDGSPVTDGVLADSQHLGFTEPFFNRAANSGRSPTGTINFDVRDTAVHAFDPSQPLYYVVLIVLDDDNGRGYPSHFAPHDGTDMAFVMIDLS